VTLGTVRGLRRGYTTGTCAAAGAKAAALALFAAMCPGGANRAGACVRGSVDVTLPRGGRLSIPVDSISVSGGRAVAVIVKDAGDDPDVTDCARIPVEVEWLGENTSRTGVAVRGGEGVGTVTMPGLKVPPGRAAINPVPLSMIRTAVREAAGLFSITPSLRVTVSVERGAEIAKKTMNARLGIVGGISILGTTGIVEPMSLSAYTSSISDAVSVALALGLKEVVFSTGRSTERVVERELGMAGQAYVLTGDHMGFALRDAAARRGIGRVTVAGQFGKFSKLAAGHFETHCRDSSVSLASLSELAARCGAPRRVVRMVEGANTAREVFLILKAHGQAKVLKAVCRRVRSNAEARLKGACRVRAVLVGYENEIACRA